MVRSRTSRIVVSQQDVRQTKQPVAGIVTESQVATPVVPCSWCRGNGQRFACLSQFSLASRLHLDNFYPPPEDWTTSSEGWVPASGPCCEDCLEAAFERRRREDEEGGGGCADGGGGGGGDHGWCGSRGRHACLTLQQGWTQVCGWLHRARQHWPSHRAATQAERWGDVQFEAEGFLQVTIMVERLGALQHLECDFPTDIPLALLKGELATLIDVAAEAQSWFYSNQRMDETKTLEDLNVDLGAILEVKCRV